MKRALHIGPDLSLPLDAITQTFGILAVRGAGKSNLAAAMAEEMYVAHLPFVVIDPVGSWHGLRARGGDGKGEGLAIPIFGGRHGDVPLERTAGQLLADLVVDQRLTCVLDVSEFSEGDKIRFLIDFAERLYRRNTEPLHLFLEEADDYAPQRPMREQARLLGAWQNIVRRGRARGLGITMITQRSAVLNKDVLTQIETLFVLRTTSPQDRAAIEAWVKYQGGAPEMLKTLPTLEAGEAWVWSPSWLKTFKRVHVRRRWTFDSGATPKGGKASKPSTLAEVDLGAIRDQMAATIERAKLDDPKALRAELARREQRISELQRELERAKASAEPTHIPVPALTARERSELAAMIPRLERIVADLRTTLAPADVVVNSAGRVVGQGTRLSSTRPQTSEPERPTAGKPVVEALRRTPTTSNGAAQANSVSKYGLLLLETMARRAPMRLTLQQLAVLSGRSRHSSSFDGALAELNREHLVEKSGEQYALTDAGRAHVPHVVPTTGSGDVLDQWRRALPSYSRLVLDTLVEAHPKALTLDEVAERIGRSRSSSSFDTAVSALRKNGLVTSPEAASLRASEDLF